jgi:hypothetical protein
MSGELGSEDVLWELVKPAKRRPTLAWGKTARDGAHKTKGKASHPPSRPAYSNTLGPHPDGNTYSFADVLRIA